MTGNDPMHGEDPPATLHTPPHSAGMGHGAGNSGGLIASIVAAAASAIAHMIITGPTLVPDLGTLATAVVVGLATYAASRAALVWTMMRHRGAMSGMDQMLFVSLDKNLRVLDCNTFFLEVVGREKGDVVGNGLVDSLVPPEMQARVREELLPQGVKKPEAAHVEFPLLAASGERKRVFWRVMPGGHPHGGKAHLMCGRA